LVKVFSQDVDFYDIGEIQKFLLEFFAFIIVDSGKVPVLL